MKKQQVHIALRPYYERGQGGWAVIIEDLSTGEIWRKVFPYMTVAKKLKDDLKGKSLENILYIYGAHYFERVDRISRNVI